MFVGIAALALLLALLMRLCRRLVYRFFGECLFSLEHPQSGCYGWVVLVDVFGPGLFVKDVVDDARVDETLKKLVRLAYHQISALQSVLVGKGSKLLHGVLTYKILRHIRHAAKGVELPAVVVGIVEGIL